MFSPEIAYLVNKERHKDRLRELEGQRLIRATEGQQSGNEGWLGKVAGWAGNRLKGWELKLQRNILVYKQVLSRHR